METYIDFTKDLEAEATTIVKSAAPDSVMHMHSSYELIYVPSGVTVTLVTAGETRTVEHPMIALVAPFCMHFSYFVRIVDPERTRRVVLYIGDAFLKSMPDGLVSPDELMGGARVRIFDLSGKEEAFLRTLGLIVDMETDKKVWDRNPGIVSRLAVGILLEQLRALSESGADTMSDHGQDGYITQVPLWILRHLSENLHTGDIAQAFYVSRDKLNKDFFAYMQTSVRKFIISLRLNKAKQLLMEGNVSVQEITEQCGFENEIYFYTFFKKNVGMTPKEYAKQYEDGKRYRVRP